MDRELKIFLLIFVGFMLSIFIGAYYLEKNACYSKYSDFQPEYHGLVTGCLVQYKGKTVPVESLRVMD